MPEHSNSGSEHKDKTQLPTHRALDLYSVPQLEPNPAQEKDGLNHHVHLPALLALQKHEPFSRGGVGLAPGFGQNNDHSGAYAPMGNHLHQHNQPHNNSNDQNSQLHHRLRHTSPDVAVRSNARNGEENGHKLQVAERAINHESKMDRTGLNKIIGELFPRRRHLGTIVYNPTTTWSTLQISQLHGLDQADKDRLLEIQGEYNHRLSQNYTEEEKTYIPVIPPLPEAYVNSYIDVKIPYKFVKEHLSLFISGKVQRRRELWGGFGDIYTDDSDVLSVLTHLGLFNNALDLSGTNPSWTAKDVARPLNVYHDEDGFELLDLSVTLLLLPPLLQYHGFYRNGINSRSWLGDSPHDGLSYGVFSIKWETYLASIGERNLYKWALKEDAVNREYEKALLNSGFGWKFDINHYRQLKQKYKTLEDNTAS